MRRALTTRALLRHSSFRALGGAHLVGAVADGIGLATLTSLTGFTWSSPPPRALACALLFFVPFGLLSLASLSRKVRAPFAGWDRTAVLVVGGFLRAGVVFLLSWATTLTQVWGVALALGALSELLALTRGSVRRSLFPPGAWPDARKTIWTMGALAGLAGFLLGDMLYGRIAAKIFYYTAAGLYLAAAYLAAGIGRVEDETS